MARTRVTRCGLFSRDFEERVAGNAIWWASFHTLVRRRISVSFRACCDVYINHFTPIHFTRRRQHSAASFVRLRPLTHHNSETGNYLATCDLNVKARSSRQGRRKWRNRVLSLPIEIGRSFRRKYSTEESGTSAESLCHPLSKCKFDLYSSRM